LAAPIGGLQEFDTSRRTPLLFVSSCAFCGDSFKQTGRHIRGEQVCHKEHKNARKQASARKTEDAIAFAVNRTGDSGQAFRLPHLRRRFTSFLVNLDLHGFDGLSASS